MEGKTAVCGTQTECTSWLKLSSVVSTWNPVHTLGWFQCWYFSFFWVDQHDWYWSGRNCTNPPSKKGLVHIWPICHVISDKTEICIHFSDSCSHWEKSLAAQKNVGAILGPLSRDWGHIDQHCQNCTMGIFRSLDDSCLCFWIGQYTSLRRRKVQRHAISQTKSLPPNKRHENLATIAVAQV